MIMTLLVAIVLLHPFPGFMYTTHAHAGRLDFSCAYSLSAPTIDGVWTSENEWADATEYNVTSRGQKCFFHLKHNGYKLFILVGLVSATNLTSMYTEVLVGIDVNGQGGVAPQNDDYLFRMLFTSESYGIMETILFDQGNGVAWIKPKWFMRIDPKAGFGVGGYSAGKNPYSSDFHWLCEMEISLKFLGARETYGFYISAYNSDLNTLFLLPGAGSVECPDSWGRLVGLGFPDLFVTRLWTGNGSGTWIFPKPGQEYYVCVTVKNKGTASAFGARLSFKILFEDHPQQPEMYLGFVESAEQINPGQNRTLILYVPASYSWLRRLGEHRVTVIVNEDRSTPEMDYGDNELTTGLVIGYGSILRVRVPYGGLTVKIDGKAYLSDWNGEVSEALRYGRHTVEVPRQVFPSYGVEATFLKFSDGHNATFRVLGVDEDLILEARYSVRYLLEVESKYGSVSGGGWFPAGTVANLSVAPSIEFGNGTRVSFVRWILPGNLSQTGYTARVWMDGQKKAQAVWVRQFYLKVKSEIDLPRGEGWYDQGTVATVMVDEVSGVVIVHTFQEWVGDVRTTMSKASVLMNSPKEAVALWKTDRSRFYIVLTFVSAMIGFAGLILRRIQRIGSRRMPARRRY